MKWLLLHKNQRMGAGLKFIRTEVELLAKRKGVDLHDHSPQSCVVYFTYVSFL